MVMKKMTAKQKYWNSKNGNLHWKRNLRKKNGGDEEEVHDSKLKNGMKIEDQHETIIFM